MGYLSGGGAGLPRLSSFANYSALVAAGVSGFARLIVVESDETNRGLRTTYHWTGSTLVRVGPAAPMNLLMAVQTTKTSGFNPALTKSGSAVDWDWGDGSWTIGSNSPSKTYGGAGRRVVACFLNDARSTVTTMALYSQGLVGCLPNVFSDLSSLTDLNAESNSLTGSLPAIASPLAGLKVNSNQMSGTIAGIPASMITLRLHSNQFSNYTAGTLAGATALAEVTMQTNLLPLSAVHSVLADLVTNALARSISASRSGTAQGGSSNTVTLDAGASGTNNDPSYRVISITGGTGSGQKRIVTAYDGSTKIATVHAAWSTVPDGTSTFSIGTIAGCTANLSGQTPAAIPTGQGASDKAALVAAGWTVTTD